MRVKTPRVETSSSDAFDAMPEITQIEMLTLADACVSGLQGLSVEEVPNRFLHSAQCLTLGAAALECGRELKLISNASASASVGALNRISTDALQKVARQEDALAPVRFGPAEWIVVSRFMYGQLEVQGYDPAPQGYSFVQALASGEIRFRPFADLISR